jgi:hypothetical protein
MDLPRPGSGILGTLMRVPVDYILESNYGGVVAAMPLPGTPSDISFTRNGSTDQQYTLTDSAERWNKLRDGVISISGRSGVEPRTGLNANGALIFQPGPVLVDEFEAWLEKTADTLSYYQGVLDRMTPEMVTAQANVYADVLRRPSLTFRAYNQKAHYRCTIQEFTKASSAGSSRHSYEWKLVLKVVGPAEALVPGNALSPVSDWAQEAAAGIDAVNAYVGAASNVLTNLRKDLDTLRAPLLALERTAAATQQVVAGVRSVAEFPRDALADLNRAAARFHLACQDALDLWDVADQTSAEYRRFKSLVGIAAIAEATVTPLCGGLGVWVGQPTETSEITTAENPVYERRRPRASITDGRVVTLRAGEDLRDVAERTLGVRSQWRTLAWVNGWSGPSTLSNGAQARPGATILVPGDASETGSTDPLDPMGTDLFFNDETQDLEIVGNDLRTISGDPNAVQALRDRLTTSQGDYRLWPDYGLPMVLGGAMTAQAVGSVSAHVSEQLLADYRVESVKNLVVTDEGAAIRVDATANLSDGRSMPLIVPLPTEG